MILKRIKKEISVQIVIFSALILTAWLQFLVSGEDVIKSEEMDRFAKDHICVYAGRTRSPRQTECKGCHMLVSFKPVTGK